MAPKRILQSLALVLLIALGWILWPVAAVVLVGGYAVLITDHPFGLLIDAVKGKRSLAAAMATAGLTIAVFLPAGLVVALAIDESLDALPALQQAFRRIGGLEGLTARLPPAARMLTPTLAKGFMEAAVGLLSRLSQLAPKLVSSIGWAIADVFLTLVTVYYLFREGPRLSRIARRLLPLPPIQSEILLREFRRVALGLFWGGLVTCAYHGLAAGFGYALFGVRRVVLLGALTAVAAFIPLVGTAVVWLPLVIGLWLEGHLYRSVGLAVWSLSIVGAGDYLLRPLVSKGQMAMPRLLLFLTIFGGVQLLGAKGILLGPLIGSLAAAVIGMLADEPRREGAA
ncbi:MAG: AI-2E family transporter [Myxococcales bacterium]